jgi:uncharacterized protein
MAIRCNAHDEVTVSRREKTPEGYLVAPAVIGRCGIQAYSRGELGLDGDANAIVRLMRTPEEVFRPETVRSFENKPITHRHPDKGVDAAHWKDFAKGNVRDVKRNPDGLLGGTTWVMDATEVDRVMSGNAYLSCGYSFDLDLSPGVAPDGQPYDGFQRNILGDHLAILDRSLDSPRAGTICRIADAETERTKIMSQRKLAVDGLPRFEIDELAAESIETAFKKIVGDRDQVVVDFASHVKESKAKLATADAKLTESGKAIAARDAEIKRLGDELKAAKAIDVDALVAERASVIADAKKMAPNIEPKGSSAAIRRAAVIAACGDATNNTVISKLDGMSAGIEKATDAQINTAFAVLLALPRQQQLAAQDSALAGIFGSTVSSSVAGPTGQIEIVDLASRPDICVGGMR